MSRVLTSSPTNVVNLSVPGDVLLDDIENADVLLTDAINQSISGGAVIVPHNLGVFTTGILTPNSGLGPLQFLTNNGSFQINAPVNPGSLTIEITNGPTAGPITFVGYNVSSNIGENYVLTNNFVFFLSIIKINRASYIWKATQ